MRFKGGRWAAILAYLSLSALMTACVHRSINQIMAEPDRYARHEVGITGQVVQSYSVLGRGAYQVDDGTGKLWIVSDKNVPRKGARVGVKGKIKNGFDLGGLIKIPEAFSSGLVMIESSHKAK